MSTYRLTFDIEIPDDIKSIDKENFENWINNFIININNDIHNCHPLDDYEIDINSNLEEI